jgi:hypothetical protein
LAIKPLASRYSNCAIQAIVLLNIDQIIIKFNLITIDKSTSIVRMKLKNETPLL